MVHINTVIDRENTASIVRCGEGRGDGVQNYSGLPQRAKERRRGEAVLAEIERIGVFALGRQSTASAVEQLTKLGRIREAFGIVRIKIAEPDSNLAVDVPLRLLRYASRRQTDLVDDIINLLHTHYPSQNERNTRKTYNAMIRALCRTNRPKAAYAILRHMKSIGLPLQKETMCSILVKANFLNMRRILGEMAGASMALTEEVFQLCFMACINDVDHARKVLWIYRSMEIFGVKRTPAVQECVLRVLASVGDVDGCIEVTHTAAPLSAGSYTACLSACATRVTTKGDRYETLATALFHSALAASAATRALFTPMMLVYATTKNTVSADSLILCYKAEVGPTWTMSTTFLAAYAHAHGIW